jgi:hypothetical protein
LNLTNFSTLLFLSVKKEMSFPGKELTWKYFWANLMFDSDSGN